MRSQLHRLLVTAGLAASALLGTAAPSHAQVRDHRHPAPEAESGPREAPPPPREERHEARREGFAWIGGRWDWSRHEHRWDWKDGHWERVKRGHKWRESRWEQRGDEWVLVDGGWVAAELRPTAAPPPPREEREGPRPGFVFLRGRWDWRDGNWTWLPGRWERERTGKRWREARWEQRGDEWVLDDGDWIDAPVLRFPTAAPPPPREERFGPRPGFVFVRGRWDWKDGNWAWLPGHWEREHAKQRWIEGRWELRGDHWEWIEGSWGAFLEHPPLDQPPPPPQREEIRPEPGAIVVPGYWAWQNGQYVWQHPRLERAVRGSRFEVGHWTKDGDHWLYINGRWVEDAAPPPPPPPPPAPPPGDWPTQAPPAPRDERFEPREGFVFIRGRYKWLDNHFEWLPGHWERVKAQKTWYDGRWEQRGNVWIYIEGGWR